MNEKPTMDEMERAIWAAAFVMSAIYTGRFGGPELSWRAADSAVEGYRKERAVREGRTSRNEEE